MNIEGGEWNAQRDPVLEAVPREEVRVPVGGLAVQDFVTAAHRRERLKYKS